MSQLSTKDFEFDGITFEQYMVDCTLSIIEKGKHSLLVREGLITFRINFLLKNFNHKEYGKAIEAAWTILNSLSDSENAWWLYLNEMSDAIEASRIDRDRLAESRHHAITAANILLSSSLSGLVIGHVGQALKELEEWNSDGECVHAMRFIKKTFASYFSKKNTSPPLKRFAV